MSNIRATFLPIITAILLGVVSSFCLAQPRDREIEAIAFDIYNGKILAAHSEQGLMAYRPLGSLPKPLVSYALLASGKSSDDVFNCRTSSSDEMSTETCWYKPGHGNLTFTSALGQSCNAWFRQWLNKDDGLESTTFFNQLGIVKPVETSSLSNPAAALCGLEENLPMPGLNCAAGFATMFNGGIILAIRANKQGIAILPIGTMRIDAGATQKVAKGMRECCAVGTGAAFGKIMGAGSALVKTGTAYAQTSARIDRTQTDGWCIALYPAEQPRLLVLVRLLGGSGSEAAAEAAKFLRDTLEQAR